MKYKFKHITYLPNYPRGNGVAEITVYIIKQILEKSEDPYLGILMYISKPLSFGRSPA